MEYFLGIVVLATVFGVGDSRPRVKRIVGGRPLEKGEWPYLVSLHFLIENSFSNKTGITHLCGGTLIAPDLVLTAAHCFDRRLISGLENKENWKVIVRQYNQYKPDEEEIERSIEQLIVHAGYTVRPLEHDVAMILLNETVDLDAVLSKVNGLNYETVFSAGEVCSVAGWGQIASQPYGYPMFLPLVTNITIVTNDDCYRDYEKVPADDPFRQELHVSGTNICAGSSIGGHDSCLGDSGGPMVCFRQGEPVLVGAVSTGYKCGLADFPGIYTRVSSYREWITATSLLMRMGQTASEL